MDILMTYIDARYISEKMSSRQTFPLRFLPFLQHMLWCVIQTSDGNFKQNWVEDSFLSPHENLQFPMEQVCNAGAGP